MTINANIRQARDKLKLQHSLFPYRCCKFATREMHSRGYEIVQGKVAVEDYCGIGEKKELVHYWNFDAEKKLYIDITASQFNIHTKRELPEIHIFKEDEMYSEIRKNLENYQVL
jgi:hypothetical protein